MIHRTATGPRKRRGYRSRASWAGLFACAGLLACDSPAEPARDDLATEVRILAATRGFESLPNPRPVRNDLVTLGRALAFDKILSGNRNIACMTCHLPEMATGDARTLSIGEGGTGLGSQRSHPEGIFIPRNSPAVFNLPGAAQLFWDGRVEEMSDGSIRTPARDQLTPEMEDVFEFGAVSAQGLIPVTSREEMRGQPGDNDLADLDDDDFRGIWGLLMERLGDVPEYVRLFERAYPGTPFDSMSFAHASNAIAGFYAVEFVFNNTPWDWFLRGDNDALSDSALAGAKDFMTIGCANCHKRSSFAGDFHNAALPQFGPGKTVGREDFGREEVTNLPGDRRRFMARPLRNVELTAPYGHLGQFATLETLVAHYNDAASQLRAYDIAEHVPDRLLWPTLLDNVEAILANQDPVLFTLRFNEETHANLVAFLRALTDASARDLSHTIPDRVPSGLPIDRMND
ncbi:MAG: cytochrome-c peroxidase [Gemmatimonadetes bacterium]|nr:cytochrome-c peroxidase [Gemmatimonadota bacterium]